MNKGLEVIEAHHLFGTPYDRIDVVVHPQSIVHALVAMCDGATLAHLGHPDMRVPIAYALHHPDRVDVPVPTLDLAEVGRAGLRAGGRGDVRLPAPGARGRRSRAAPRRASSTPPTRSPSTPSSTGRLPFLGIAEVIEATLDRVGDRPRALLRDALRGRRRARARSRASWSTGPRA